LRTRSAAYFVVRCLTAPDVPASGGAYTPVTVVAPEGSLVNARPPAAVAAGNVETSGRIVDVLFPALWRAAPVPASAPAHHDPDFKSPHLRVSVVSLLFLIRR
jgi:N-methylhydantoinase B